MSKPKNFEMKGFVWEDIVVKPILFRKATKDFLGEKFRYPSYMRGYVDVRNEGTDRGVPGAVENACSKRTPFLISPPRLGKRLFLISECVTSYLRASIVMRTKLCALFFTDIIYDHSHSGYSWQVFLEKNRRIKRIFDRI